LACHARIQEIDEPEPPEELWFGRSYAEVKLSNASLNRALDENAWLFNSYELLGGDAALFEAQSSLHPSRAIEVEVGRVKRVALALNVAHFHEKFSSIDSATYGKRASAAGARKIVARMYKEMETPQPTEVATRRVKRGAAVSLGTLERQWNERLDSLAWVYAAFSMRSPGRWTLLDSFTRKSLWPSVTHAMPRLASRARFVQEAIFPRLSWRQASPRPRDFSYPAETGVEVFEPPDAPAAWGDFSEAFRFRSKS
jgi:hypothetical protein